MENGRANNGTSDLYKGARRSAHGKPTSDHQKRRGGKGLLVGAIFRQALLDLGYSPDSHVYDVDDDYLLYEKGTASNDFVSRVRSFYRSLSPFKRRILVCDYLEKGRHYRFWWLEYADEREYAKNCHEVVQRLKEAF